MHNLYIISTPIGNLKDISKRAIETLEQVDYVLCEDTRVSSKLMQAIGLKVKFMVYNDHNAQDVISSVIRLIKEENLTFGLISDAGTPLISDPGYKLINACQENDISYTIIPGACSVISALVLSGMPSDRFMFAGFAESHKFDELSKVNSTLIFFESPNRIIKTLRDMKNAFRNRKVAVIREITKVYEEVTKGDIDFLLEHFNENPPRGEFVIVIDPPMISELEKIHDLLPLIKELKSKFSKKDLSTLLSKCFKISKNALYNFLMEYEGDAND